MADIYPPKISLAAARVNAGYDQTLASVKIGVSVETLRNWEKGNTIPTYVKVTEICEIYKYPADYIFFGKQLA